MTDHLQMYRTREWFESLAWQHRWIEFMAGWWAGEFGQPTTVIDFGAGDGWWPHTFKQMGFGHVRTIAIELDWAAEEFIQSGTEFVQHDLRTPLRGGNASDLSICLEVAEHMTEREARKVLIPTLGRYSRRILMFSAAPPEQEGTGHINLQTQDYWIRTIEQDGKLKLWRERTARVRKAFRRILPEPYLFLPRNLLIFQHV